MFRRRQKKYSKSQGDAVCVRLAKGETLRAICRDEGMPSRAAVLEWVALIPEFADQYAHARDAGLDVMAEEMLEIADDNSRDTVSTENGERPDAEWINRSRLRVDTRKWYLSKLAPKRYGEKLQAEVTGADGGPIQAAVTVRFVKPNADSGSNG